MLFDKINFAKFSSDRYYPCEFLMEISRIKAPHAKIFEDTI